MSTILSVVVPSWNGKEILRSHLPSMLEAARSVPTAEVIVSDDGSDDGTDEMLAREFPDVRLCRRRTRGGFSHAANDGVAASRGAFVVLLNNDMEARGDAFATLVAALEGDRALFAVVPSIVRVTTGEEEARTRIGFRRGVVFASDDGGAGEDPGYACGGAMAFRRQEFLGLGGFDPLYSPFYWEDVDLSYRARKRGRRIGRVEGVRVEHDHGRTIRARFDRDAVATVYERNRLLFTWKNLTDPALWLHHLLALPAKTLWDLAAHRAFVRGLRGALGLRSEVAARRRVERAEVTVRDRELLAP